MKYNKLVRDKIPGIIKASGSTPQTHIANEDEYEAKLKEKLKEEVNEFLEKQNEGELEDILEVIYAIINVKNFNKDKIESLRIKKAEERGSFKKRIILDEVID